MKKLLFISLAALFFTACEGPEGPMGPRGEDGGGMNWHNATVRVDERDWVLSGEPGDLNSYYSAYKELNAMTGYIYNYGSVIAYLETQPGVKNGMPYVLHLGEESNGSEFLWTQTYDFDFDEYGVCFYVTYSDFNTQFRPGTEIFHVVMMW